MATNTLTIVDETTAGDTFNEMEIQFSQSTATVKDIITARVEAEVQAYNERLSDRFHGLVRPTNAEETLNGYKMKKRAAIDAEKQVYVALASFQKNGYVVFIGDRQAENLDDEIQLLPDLKVSFLKITPLVGG